MLPYNIKPLLEPILIKRRRVAWFMPGLFHASKLNSSAWFWNWNIPVYQGQYHCPYCPGSLCHQDTFIISYDIDFEG